MTIEYDGTEFYGWQVQKEGRTVQGVIETALQKIIKNQKITLIGSGRTDSGVHAFGQVANIKLETTMNENELMKALNGNLDKDVFVTDCQIINSDFHARFSALKREYEYNITNSFSPINRLYSWNIEYKLNNDILDECAKLIFGEHDFTELSKHNAEVKNKICKVYYSKWTYKDHLFTYNIIANRFLHHMVRYIVGIMIEISRERSLKIDDLSSKLNRKKIDIFHKSPSKGLFLKKVYYA